MMQTPKILRQRCFVAISCQLPDTAQPLIEELKHIAPSGLRVVPAEYLHITLKFIGTVDQDQVGFLDSILRSQSRKQPILNLRCRGIELLNNSLCLGIENHDGLKQLVSKLDEGFAFLGYPAEEKEFIPHITLARFDGSAKNILKKLAEEHSNRHWNDFTFDRYRLYRSETLPEGARYTAIGDYSLDG